MLQTHSVRSVWLTLAVLAAVSLVSCMLATTAQFFVFIQCLYRHLHAFMSLCCYVQFEVHVND